MAKKIVSLLLCAAMTATVLCGCGSEAGESGATGTSESTPAQESTKDASSDAA